MIQNFERAVSRKKQLFLFLYARFSCKRLFSDRAFTFRIGSDRIKETIQGCDPMRLEQLEYLIEVAKCKSFSKASKKLFISQPSLSTAVSNLERELQTEIFHRTPQGVQVTEDGRKIIKDAEEILSKVNALYSATESKPKEYMATLAATPAACSGITTALLKRLRKSNPEITLNILEARPQEVFSYLVNGMADLIIGGYSATNRNHVLAEIQKYDFHVQTLLEESLYVFLPRSHPLARRETVSLSDLAEETQATYHNFLIMNDTPFDTEEKSNDNIPLSGNYITFSNRGGILDAVAAGLAYAVFPQEMILDNLYLSSGKIKALPISDHTTTLTTFLAWRKSNYKPEQEERILNEIQSLYLETEKRLARLNLGKETGSASPDQNRPLRY